MKEILFNEKEFYEFYQQASQKVKSASKKYNIPVTIYFGSAHAAKFK